VSGSINKLAGGLIPTSLTIYQKVNVSHSKNPVLYSYFLCEFFIRIVGGGVHIGSTRHVGHCWPIVPAPGICDDDGEFGGIKIGRGNRSTRRKPASAPLCPPQIPLA
jgi:hypothetical protein